MSVSNQEYSVFQTAFSNAVSKSGAIVPTYPDRHGDTCHYVFLDEIKVVDGVYHRQTIQALHDLIAGDEYRFPDITPDSHSNIRVKGEDTMIELRTTVQVGSATLRARRTHCITLMSDRGHVVPADVLTTVDNRLLLALRGRVSPQQDYALIEMVPTVSH